MSLVESARDGKLDRPDLDIAIGLVELLSREFEAFGTDGSGQRLDDKQASLCQRAVVTVLGRLGIAFEPLWRDFTAFRSYWIRNDGRGSWQARRDMVSELFDPVLRELERQIDSGPGGNLAEGVSPHASTGWPRVDIEIAALRQRFTTAQSPQDYRDVGNRCVASLEAMSRVVYNSEKHLREGRPSHRLTRRNRGLAATSRTP